MVAAAPVEAAAAARSSAPRADRLSFAPMSYDRRPDRRPGGGRPPGRPDRPDRPRPGGPPRDRGDYGRPPPRTGGYDDRGPRDRSFGPSPDRPPRPGGFVPRGADDGGMSIRLDPRRLAALKLLAAEAGVRPGELVTHWVEERLDAARAGGAPTAPAAASQGLAQLSARIDELVRRVDAMAASTVAAPNAAVPGAAPTTPRRGRPPKARSGGRAPGVRKVALHDEIVAVISERGPLTAAELATAIVERGRYAPPRSGKPLDAATVNSRVSNPTYRARFSRSEGRIGLAASS